MPEPGRSSGTRGGVGALPLAAMALLGCSPAPAGPPPNIVLVVVDTLRADHLGFAGNTAVKTPNFDALAQQSTRFGNAFATASWTLPSLSSIFVSQLGSQHRTVRWGDTLAGDQVTLAEQLREAGYRTAGFTANVLIDEESGFEQGFDDYEVVLSEDIFGGRVFPNAPAAAVTEAALGWLRSTVAEAPGAPFFLYLHYMEPHTPYRCLTTPACRDGAAYLSGRLLGGEWDFAPNEVAMIRGLYAAEVQAMDAALGALLAALEAEGVWPNTWIVVTSDHGEQLGERGRYLHGDSLDLHEIRVPLLLCGPTRRGAEIETPVSLIDLAPTLTDIAGVSTPTAFRGHSLRSALEGGALPGGPVVAELFQRYEMPPRDMLAVIAGRDLIVMSMQGALRGFDYESDPLGRRARRVDRAELSRALGGLENSIDFTREPPAEAPDLPPATLERLEALGYTP